MKHLRVKKKVNAKEICKGANTDTLTAVHNYVYKFMYERSCVKILNSELGNHACRPLKSYLKVRLDLGGASNY